MYVLVCGSREWSDVGPIMRRLRELPKLCTILEGGCRGADLLARHVAEGLGHDVIEFPANWVGRGKPAGPFRNAKMLDMKPDLVLAFHHDIEKSAGTKDCVRQAKERGIPVEIHSS